jgi:hypothetical protein
MGDWNAQVPTFLQRIVNSPDDRSSAVLSATVVEYHVDRILGLFAPGFDKLDHDHQLGLNMKIDLLKALSLIPDHLLTSAKAIGSTRNKFAHSLDLESFDEMDQNGKNSVRSAYYAIPGIKRHPRKELRDVWRHLLQITVMGIRLYESNVKLLAETIRSDEFLSQLEEKYRTRFNEMLEKLRKVSAGTKGISAVAFDESGEPILVRTTPQEKNPSEKQEGPRSSEGDFS